MRSGFQDFFLPQQNDVAIEDVTTPANELATTVTFTREDAGDIEGEIIATGPDGPVSETFEFTDTREETVTTTFTFDIPEGEQARVTVDANMTKPESVTDQVLATVPGPSVDGVSILGVETDTNSLTTRVQFDASEDVRIDGGVSVNTTYADDERLVQPATERVSLEPPHPSTVAVPFEWDLPEGTEVSVEISAFMTAPVARSDGDTGIVRGGSRSRLGALDRFRRPQYTGENRCTPCTVLNVAIAVALAATVSAVTFLYGVGAGGAALTGTAVFLLSAAAIYLRGYLVPGTPTFTKRYFPDWLLRRFDKRPSPAAVDERIDVEATLDRAGAVTECENEEDLCLTDDFRTAWRDRIRALRSEEIPRANLANVLDVDSDRLSIREYENAFEAWFDGRRAGQWESRAAFLADVAAANELRERHPDWDRLDLEHRSRLLNGLRIFLERCPACDGRVTLDQSLVESCCRSVNVVAMTCEDCGARLFEVEQHHESDENI